MFPFFFAAFFTFRDGVLFSLFAVVALSLRCFFLGGGLASASSWFSSSLSHCFIFSSISLLLPTATILHMWDSNPLMLQNVPGQRSSRLGETTFLLDTTDNLLSSCGQHTTQCSSLGFLVKPRVVLKVMLGGSWKLVKKPQWNLVVECLWLAG